MLSDILRLELQFMVKVMVTLQVSINDRIWGRYDQKYDV